MMLSAGRSTSTSRSEAEVNGLRGSMRYLSAMATAVFASNHEQLMAEFVAGEDPLRSNSARPPRLLMRTRTTCSVSSVRPSLSSRSSPS